MKFSKTLAVLCAFAAGTTCFTVRAEDNPAQAAARIALAKQLFELNSQQTSNAAPAAATASVTAKPVNNSEAKAKAKADKAAAKAKAKQEAENQQAAQTKTAADQAAVETAAKQEAEKKADAERAALAAAQAERAKTQAPAKAEKQANPSATPSNYAGKDLGMKPMATPPLPISATKEERLQTLLGKYKADQISPEEYHKQRAAILAEP